MNEGLHPVRRRGDHLKIVGHLLLVAGLNRRRRSGALLARMATLGYTVPVREPAASPSQTSPALLPGVAGVSREMIDKLEAHLARRFGRQWTFRRDPVRQRLAFQILHDQVRRAVLGLPHVVDVHDGDDLGVGVDLIGPKPALIAAAAGAFVVIEHTGNDILQLWQITEDGVLRDTFTSMEDGQWLPGHIQEFTRKNGGQVGRR